MKTKNGLNGLLTLIHLHVHPLTGLINFYNYLDEVDRCIEKIRDINLFR